MIADRLRSFGAHVPKGDVRSACTPCCGGGVQRFGGPARII